MKRLGLIMGLLLLLFAVGSFAMQGSAQDDAVPILQTQVADLQTRVAALEAASGTPVSSQTAIGDDQSAYLFQGSGRKVTDPITVRHASYRADFACGNTMGTVEIYSETTMERLILVGESVIAFDAGTYVLNISCQGDWTFTLTPIAF